MTLIISNFILNYYKIIKGEIIKENFTPDINFSEDIPNLGNILSDNDKDCVENKKYSLQSKPNGNFKNGINLKNIKYGSIKTK